MTPSAELRERIATLIDQYCSESSEEPKYLKLLASQHRVLPVLVDWAGFFGLYPSGEVLVVPTEEDGEAYTETDERLRRIAIFRGTKRYPDLKPLVPRRPPEALDCHHCEGQGRIDIPGVEADTIVCYCGGLGWLTKEEVINVRRLAADAVEC